MRKKVLFICGSMNQTTQMHQIAGWMKDYDQYFSPFFSDGLLGTASDMGLLEFTIMGRKRSDRTLEYLRSHDLQLDIGGYQHAYDLVLTCTDLIVPKHIRRRKIVLVQEGMTEPETTLYHLARNFQWIPRWVAGTATTGLSDAYEKFCVASEGYRELFIRKGVNPAKIVVTSIPNFDNCAQYLQNDFKHHDYVLVCTSDNRETFIYENRPKNIRKYLEMAEGSQLLFKLHPNEHVERAMREIALHAPESLVFSEGRTEEMIANSRMMIAQFSSTIFVGSALNKVVHCGLDPDELKRLTPLQNRSAAKLIAEVCRTVLDG
ncbi:UDP-N-acetyl glucosamine 2-epimerase [Chlorobium sp. BLA1]|uniref:UDP-N-acetyl glucosamine 2-epimerase n=1 Tax=Candidatus Chlorobium masyuteum TaxID=2716876 RepID=UPI00141FFC7B|nr:UDP-N-acetyl glucosamine 2-epimerase [Candidatus Chlorobium masyuteum]NHQ60469.1 UDP-N-acetyl glucosamine 2-epimerase [Candidatus Chlorobium masyuteum]NTU43952.1 UDP-N-acetyl glucosamine 2-epimerase [Chlorobiaceae bacterium]